MAYEEELARAALAKRIYRHARRAGEIRSGDRDAPGNRSLGPVEDISGGGLTGFALTGGPAGGFVTNPGGV